MRPYIRIGRITGLIIIFLCVHHISYAQEVIIPWKGIKDTRVRMWVYKPDEGKSNGMGVIICPGGSYHHLGIKHEGHQVARRMVQEGYTAFVLRYSTGTYGYKYPSMMQDIQRVMQYVNENASQLGIAQGATGVMGFSAGGHLAGWMGTYFDTNLMEEYGIEPAVSLKPAFVAMIYPVVSMHDEIAHVRSRNNLMGKKYPDSLALRLSLEDNIRKDMPPVFLLACEDDPVVNCENSIRYNKALDKWGVPHLFAFYEEGGHGFGYGGNKTEFSTTWIDIFFSWMDTVFGSKKSIFEDGN
ncbi:MAG: alpha/beta hydrolase [Bacteroidales bacterium]|nr:alpha/beta hydrolase [Bacteroidales bacterium]MDD4256558.1 alpha/beta hydrolase [Bacteroidales bacterium]MDD4654799.1 alpha/beta hydrolase [Bacteroidales bacterium]